MGQMNRMGGLIHTFLFFFQTRREKARVEKSHGGKVGGG